jgi:uncharacterized membrane protein
MVAPAVYLAFVWKNIPEKVALHFDWSGKPDRFGSKSELLTTSLVLVLTSFVVYLILVNIYRIDPKKYAAENKGRLKRLAFGVVTFIAAVLCMIIYSSSHGNISFSSGFLLAGMGLLFAFIGNYMHNLKPNYFAGFRLPWTLENEDNWKKTHALAGKMWFAGGLLLAIICLFLRYETAFIVFFTVLGILTIVPIIYSFRMFQNSKEKK